LRNSKNANSRLLFSTVYFRRVIKCSLDSSNRSGIVSQIFMIIRASESNVLTLRKSKRMEERLVKKEV